MLLMQFTLAIIVGLCLLACIDELFGGLFALFLLGLFLRMLLVIHVKHAHALLNKEITTLRYSLRSSGPASYNIYLSIEHTITFLSAILTAESSRQSIL